MSQTWNLKKAAGDENAEIIVGRFQDPIEMEKAKNLCMYMREEVVADDDMDNAEDGMPKRKKNRRRGNAKSKMYINLEEAHSSKSSSSSSQSEKIQVQGNLVETSTEGGNSANYALLQVVKKEGAASTEMTINVVQVGDWYHFRKPDVARPVMSLDEIDMQFENHKKYQKEANKKYKKITAALDRIAPVADGDEKTAAPESFGTKAPKGGRKGVAAATVSSDAMEEDGETEDFDAHERAFSELEAQEYESEASDDQEDARALQAVDNDREENELDGATAWDDMDWDSDDEDEEDSSDEEERPAEVQKVDRLVLAGYELKDHLAAAAAKAIGGAARSASPPAKDSKKKRPREGGAVAAPGSASTLAAASGVGEVGAAVKKGRTGGVDKTPAGAAAPPPASKAYLTEDMVREAMARMGGRVNSKNLYNELRKPIKRMGDVGKDRLKEILKSIATLEKDPVMGTVFVLKK